MHELPPAIDVTLVRHSLEGTIGAPALDIELLAKTRRAHAKRGALPQRKAAMTREPLEALHASCDDSLKVGRKTTNRSSA